MRHFRFILLIALLIPLWTQAANYRLFTSEKDLSSTLINKLYFDRNGMIWVATENGLNRFDGSKFQTYYHDPANPHSIAHNYVTGLFEDSEGHLFIMTYGGLQLYRPETDDFSILAKTRNSFSLFRSSYLFCCRNSFFRRSFSFFGCLLL